jgi:hypothetical protein
MLVYTATLVSLTRATNCLIGLVPVVFMLMKITQQIVAMGFLLRHPVYTRNDSVSNISPFCVTEIFVPSEFQFSPAIHLSKLDE